MAFIISKATKYTWPVKVEMAVDGGRFEKHTFDVEFKRLPQSRLAEIMEEIKGSKITDLAICKEIVVGWNGIVNESGAVPFSEKALDDLLDISTVASSVVMAFFESVQVLKTKN